MQKNYYDILQVPPNASFNDIKKAYRVLAKKYHPDAASNENNTHLFFDIQIAYETLSNPSLRQAYHYKHFTTSFNKSYELTTLQLCTQLQTLLHLLQQINKDAINFSLLKYQLQQLVHNNFFSILRSEKNEKLQLQYCKLSCQLIGLLPYPMAVWFYTILEQYDNEFSSEIKLHKKKHFWQYKWHQYKLLLVIIVVAIACIAMYFAI